jgi:D-alanine transaminase
MNTVFLNGEYLPRADARLSVEERGFLFGDGVYEVIPAYAGSFVRMGSHLRRLRHGLSELRIEYDADKIERIAEELIERNGLVGAELSIVYLQITRGAAPRTHHFPPAGTRPTVYAYATAYPRPTPAEWSAGYTAITVPDRRWARVDVKTVQLLPNVLAQEAARAAGVSDALFVRDGIAIEGAHNNLFTVFGRTVRTHPTTHQILPGITREIVLEVALERGYDVEERATPLDAIPSASEVFMTGSTTEVRPLVKIDGRPVGDGRVGPVAHDLREGLLETIRREARPRVKART